MNRVFLSKSARREREALDWVQRLHNDAVTEVDIEAYVLWVEADPANAEVFRRLDAAWIAAADASDSIRARFGPEARSQGNADSWWSKGGRLLQPGLTPRFAAVCSVLLILAVVVLQPSQQSGDVQRFATAVGEQRDVTLADGSVLTLNTGSEMTVAFEKDLRTVSLLSGEALFDVASDPNRPFVVRMEKGAVEVLGTVFDILRKDDGFSVSVLEGRVSVSADVESPAPNKAVVLTPNQGAEVNTKLASLSSFAIDAEVATAWRRGQLIYRDASLNDVIADLNRYTTSSISLQTPGLGEQTFTGVLTIGPHEEMVARLAALLRLESVPAEDGGLRLQSAK